MKPKTDNILSCIFIFFILAICITGSVAGIVCGGPYRLGFVSLMIFGVAILVTLLKGPKRDA